MDDLELLQKCINGDKLSREEFLGRYSRLIYSYIHHIINSKGFSHDQGLIQDIFQEIFRTLYDNNCDKLKSFKAKNHSTLATWLRQVVINFTIDYLRRVKVFVSLDAENELGSSLGELIEDKTAPADEIIGLKEKMKQLTHCIDTLDLDEKFFIELHFYRKVGLEELKRILKVTRGAIDMQKQRLMNKLKDCFKVKGFLLDF